MHLTDDWALDTKMRVAPMARLGVALPGIRKANSPRKTDFPVHDHDFSMSAMVDAQEFERQGKVKFHKFGACFAQLPDFSSAQFRRTHRVNEDVNFDTSLGAFGEGIGKCLGNLPGFPDVCFERDGMLGAPNGFQHGREYFVPIVQFVDAIALNQRRPQHMAD